MPLPPEVNEWIARAEVDHIGPFVSAWAAFNAWYRHVSASTRDRDSLSHVCQRPNSVRSALLPLLDPLTEDTPAAVEFKAMIASLHTALEAYRLEALYHDKVEVISLRSVPIYDAERLPYTHHYSGCRYRIDKVNKKWISTVANRSGTELVRIDQDQYDENLMTRDAQFIHLSPTQQSQLRGCYLACTPRPMADLLSGNENPILAGTITFTCTCEELFSGIVQTIYRMRNMLLHGELSPHREALACYQPAYQLLRRMLRECH